MRKLAVLLMMVVSATLLRGQTVPGIISIPPQQCVWRAGDDPAWAMPKFGDSTWPSYSNWKPDPLQPSLWIRCRADLSELHTLTDPTILVEIPAPYQVFVDGRRIGGMGDLGTGFIDGTYATAWPVPQPLTTSSAKIAAHIVYRREGQWGSIELKAGSRSALLALRDAQTFALARSAAPMAVCFIVVGVVGLALLGLYLGDRSRFDILVLGLDCVALSIIRLREFALLVATSIPISLFWSRIPNDITQIITFAGPVLLFFLLARRRIPPAFWLMTGVLSLWFALVLAADLAPAGLSLHASAILFSLPVVRVESLSGIAVEIAAAWVAYRPWNRLPRNVQWIAALWLIQFAADSLWLVIEAFSDDPGGSNLFLRWHYLLANIRAITLVAVVIALLALLLLDQRRISGERALLAGEMHAARNVQEYLISKHLPETPGLDIRSEYRPSREVGGDFFQVLPLPGDGVLVIVGDVAGKGMEAGMLAALIVGAVRTAAAFTSDPERILALLNERLQGRGLVTCIALRIEGDGSAALVNAGHLPPYLNGKELGVEGSLPLGAVPGIHFPTSRFSLAANDSLLLMTDGVAEAQNAEGQLFGFERIGELLRKGVSAAALANAAQRWGQEDDITVLTLTFAPAEVAHA